MRYAQSLDLIRDTGRNDVTAKNVLLAVASQMKPVLKRGQQPRLPLFWPGVSYGQVSVDEVRDLTGLGRTAVIQALGRLSDDYGVWYCLRRYTASEDCLGQREPNGYLMWAQLDHAHHEALHVLFSRLDEPSLAPACDRRQQGLRPPRRLLAYSDDLSETAFRLLVHIDRAAMRHKLVFRGSEETRPARISVCAHLLDGAVLRDPIEKQGAWVLERREALRELYREGFLRDRFVRDGGFVSELRLDGRGDESA